MPRITSRIALIIVLCLALIFGTWFAYGAWQRNRAASLQAKIDKGQAARAECSMIKVFATEMAQETIDHAMQAFGAMGVTKELPLHLMASHVRLMRVYEGPSEVHRMLIARYALQGRVPDLV